MNHILRIAVWSGYVQHCSVVRHKNPKSLSDTAPHASRPLMSVSSQGVKLSLSSGFRVVFERVSPSTVGIAACHRVDGRFRPTRMGTAFAWDHQGHLVTNAHIVAEADLIRVRRRDGKPFEAKIVGLDAATDLAVLKVVALVYSLHLEGRI